MEIEQKTESKKVNAFISVVFLLIFLKIIGMNNNISYLCTSKDELGK
jgi:hypothetical protein